ncbi:MAG: hypothetical protein EOO86_15690 [Pedobacter sp.]|nr:MAG: hypothetical protein EOO86_15690 [Pedobacter sp.]
MKILFGCSNFELSVMLRHEASATDETDASCLSMTEIYKKIETESRASIKMEYCLGFPNLF